MKSKIIGWWLYAIAFVFVTFMCIISGNFFSKRMSVEIGEIAKETVFAPFQVENEIATERKRKEAAERVETVTKRDSAVQEQAISKIEELFKNVNAIQTSDIAATLEKTEVEVLSGRSSVSLYDSQYQELLDASTQTLEQVKSTCIKIASDLFAEGITQNNNGSIAMKLKQAVDASELSARMKRIAEDIIADVLAPNVVEDEAATNENRKVEADKEDPVYVMAQEKIVEKGSKVTEEVYKLLEKVGYLETDPSDRIRQYLGVGLFILIVACLFIYYIMKAVWKDQRSSKQIKQDKRLSLVFILLTLAMITTRGMLNLSFVYLPLGIVCMMITFAIGPHIAFMTQILVVTFSALVFKGDIVFILYFIIQGIAGVLIVTRMHERTRTLLSAAQIGVIQFVTYIALKLLIGTPVSVALISEGLVAFIVGIISVVTVIGALPMFESLFDFVTPMQLLEMTNPSQPLLKRLLLEATGTYYHSLLVANLAEAAASSVGANPLLARVGGYYHDIGKLTCSNYFKENQGTTNPHDYMSPKESYDVIVSHVTSGITIAEEYHLPNYIKDFIRQHHGTSTMQYFYLKAQKATSEVVLEKAFMYPGPKPQTKETALVMLADIVEATTRAMQDKLGKEIQIEDLVRKSIKQKLDEGQLSECELYLSDIDKIAESFTKMLTGMYHQRIVYPERNDKR